MDTTKIDINEIAQYLDGGMICFVHKKTMELVYFPDPDQFFDDVEEFWGKDMKKVDDNIGDYIKINKMRSSNSFRIMEDFTNTIKNQKLKSQLQNALENRKPFRNWNNIIHNTGEEREDWFKFKQKRMELWVSCQIEADDIIIAEKYYARRSVVPKVAVSGISRVVYHVGDLEEGADWYTTVLNLLPSSESETEVVFTMDMHELVLQKRVGDIVDSKSLVLVYWNTDYLTEILYRLEETDHGVVYIQYPEPDKQGVTRGIIEDPWGNPFGLISDS